MKTSLMYSLMILVLYQGLVNCDGNDSDMNVVCYSCSSADNTACRDPMETDYVDTQSCPGYECATMRARHGGLVVRGCSCTNDAGPDADCETCYGDRCNGPNWREEIMMSASAGEPTVTLTVMLMAGLFAILW